MSVNGCIRLLHFKYACRTPYIDSAVLVCILVLVLALLNPAREWKPDGSLHGRTPHVTCVISMGVQVNGRGTAGVAAAIRDWIIISGGCFFKT